MEQANIINIEVHEKKDKMIAAKTTLKRSLEAFQERKRAALNDPDFCVYDYLEGMEEEGFSSANVYKWTNKNNKCLPDPHKIIVICNQIGDNRPMEAIVRYMQAMVNQNEVK